MGLAELEDKIRGDGRREIAEIKKEARKKTAETKKEFSEKADQECGRITKEGKQKEALLAKKIRSAAKISAQTMIASEKNRILDGVFSKAGERVLSLPDVEKKKVMVGLSRDRACIDGETAVVVDRKYAGLLGGVGGVRVGDVGDFGLMVESSDGLVRIDNRLGKILEGFKTSLKPELVKILFGGK